MDWISIEIPQLFNLIKEKSIDWDPEKVILYTNSLGNLVKHQLERYMGGKYRRDRNETLGFFEAIDKFAKTNLPISLEHFQTLVHDYRKRILPYPHYSGIKIMVPEGLASLDKISLDEIPM